MSRSRGLRVVARAALACSLLGVALAFIGCGTGPRTVNPTFDTSVEQAEELLREVAENPKRPDRPILLVGGYFDPTGVEIAGMRKQLEANFGEHNVHAVRYFAFSNFDRLAAELIQETDDAFGNGTQTDRTVTVDVVALSMGGLVSRHAALVGDAERGRTLDIRRLFTAGTPHRGAALATKVSPDALVRDMTPGSEFLQGLEDARPDADYELVSYVRLGDGIVGEANAAPPGQTPIWVDSMPWHRPHADALHDPRIQADIVLRLRGLLPLARQPQAPLPD